MSNDDMVQKAHEMYSKLQGKVPDTFKNPHTFNKEFKEIDPNADPQQLLYRTTNAEYGNFAPSLIDMPTDFHGKGEAFLKQQNYYVYRDSRMNCEMDKHRYMNPTATIRGNKK